MNYSASNLTYRLIDGPACLEPLRVLDSRALDWHGWRVTFCALAASHAVRLERADVQLTELLTCAPPAGTPSALIAVPADVPGALCLAARGLLCRVRLTLFSLDEGDALQGDFPASDQLTVSYPASPDHATPMTRLGWRAEQKCLYVETVHTYPEEGRGVRSVSVFELLEATT